MARQIYQRPPIDEVVAGIQFAPLERWRVGHAGLLWGQIRDRFTSTENASPLDATDQNVDAESGLPLPRVWLVSKDESELVQLQRNRFIYNWRKRRDDQRYAGYESIHDKFLTALKDYENFLEAEEIGSVNLKQVELAYINALPKGQGWTELANIGRMIPSLGYLRNMPYANSVTGFESSYITADLPLSFHPVAIRASTQVAPSGAG